MAYRRLIKVTEITEPKLRVISYTSECELKDDGFLKGGQQIIIYTSAIFRPENRHIQLLLCAHISSGF